MAKEKFLKFQDVNSSANVAGTFYYVAVSDINYVQTGATTVTILLEKGETGNGDAQNDSIVITCSSGDSQKIADKLLHIAGSISNNMIFGPIDKDFIPGDSISDISPAT
tara:strand:+ start:7763 stop:8089 length:327 start_codon:yes stop_codon:yes gene_type:complete